MRKRITAICIVASLILLIWPRSYIEARSSEIYTEALVETSYYEKDSYSYKNNGIYDNIVLFNTSKGVTFYYKVFPIEENIAKYNEKQGDSGYRVERIRYGRTIVEIVDVTGGKYEFIKNPQDYVSIEVLSEGEYKEIPTLYTDFSRGYGRIVTRDERTLYDEPECFRIKIKGNLKKSLEINCYSAVRIKFKGFKDEAYLGNNGHFAYVQGIDKKKITKNEVSLKGGKGIIKIDYSNMKRDNNQNFHFALYSDKKCTKRVGYDWTADKGKDAGVLNGLKKGKYYVKYYNIFSNLSFTNYQRIKGQEYVKCVSVR